MDSFSTRHGFSSINQVEITIREDAPEKLRGFFLQLTYDCGFKPTKLRELVCKKL